MKEISENQIENERLDDIVNTAKDILHVNNQNQEGQELKILTPNQMLSRLPISLAQLKAGNNSEKLRNEIRQLLYSLIVQRNYRKQSINIWLVLFKNGNNIYEH